MDDVLGHHPRAQQLGAEPILCPILCPASAGNGRNASCAGVVGASPKTRRIGSSPRPPVAGKRSARSHGGFLPLLDLNVRDGNVPTSPVLALRPWTTRPQILHISKTSPSAKSISSPSSAVYANEARLTFLRFAFPRGLGRVQVPRSHNTTNGPPMSPRPRRHPRPRPPPLCRAATLSCTGI